MIARPSDTDTATLRGAAQYGLSRKTIVSTVIVPRAYIMKVSVVAFGTRGCAERRRSNFQRSLRTG